MTKELAKGYEPHDVEKRWYSEWETKGYFSAAATSDKKPYSIVIPPPNVTGALHMGHALNNTLQDILCRWKRMQGYNVLWMPGIVYAGINAGINDIRHLADIENNIQNYSIILDCIRRH